MTETAHDVTADGKAGHKAMPAAKTGRKVVAAGKTARKLHGLSETGKRRKPVSASIRTKGVVTIPQQFRDQLHLDEGDQVIVTIRDGSIVLTPAAVVPRDQEWFWTPEWQAKEAEAEAEIAAGGGTVYTSSEDFLKALDVA